MMSSSMLSILIAVCRFFMLPKGLWSDDKQKNDKGNYTIHCMLTWFRRIRGHSTVTD